MRIIPPYRARIVKDGIGKVVLGSGVYPVRVKRPPVEFFLKYVPRLLPEGWLEHNSVGHGGAPHPLAIWWQSLAADWSKIPERADIKVIRRHLRPESAAMTLLANDLYTLDLVDRLQSVLVERATRNRGFQGVAHEIAVAATMVRAGFELRFEDESDVRRKHPEFVGRHYESGAQVAVEAKSVHRTGVLGFPDGKPPPSPGSASSNEVAAQVRRQLERALCKAQDLPFVVFVDLNLPPGVLDARVGELEQEFRAILPKVDPLFSEHGVRTGRIMNLLVVTNRPMQLGMQAEGYDFQNLFLTPDQAECRFPLRPQVLDDVKDAVKHHGTVKAGPG